MSKDCAKVLDYEWDIFNDILCRIGGTLTVDKAIMIVNDESEKLE